TENEDIQVLTPSLLGGDGGETQPSTAHHDSALQLWDSSVTALVRSSIGPRCSSLAGDLYVVTGRGRPGPKAEGEDAGCEAGPFWLAMCCDAPSEGGEGFSVALVREAEGGDEKEVDVKLLEEMLGVTEFFSQGCGGASEKAAVGLMVGAQRVVTTDDLIENVEHLEDSGTHQALAVEEITEQEAGVEAEVADVDVTPKTSVAEEGTTPPQDPDEEQGATSPSEAQVGTKSSHSSADGEIVEQTVAEETSNSTIIYLISTTAWLLTLPLRPVVSIITGIPGQVAYMLQELMGVLATLPGDILYLLYLVICGVLSWIRWAVEVVLDLGWGGVCCLYYCTWAMLGELLSCCWIGVTGLGSLVGYSLGIVGDTLGGAWWVVRGLCGRLWDQSGGYAWTVTGEMGGQVMTVGGGLGKLVWRSLKGVGHAIRFIGGVILGTMRLIALGVLDPPMARDDPPMVVKHLVNAE
ncbi:hypothetical protein NHX12_000855, partial [Muraenolepis orangiensis]